MIFSTTIAPAILLSLLLLFASQSQAEQTPQAVSNSIAADPLYVRLIGNFDPRADDVYFISALQITFDDYYQTQYTDILHGFDIAAIFIYQATLYELQTQATFDEAETKITSWCEIQTTFSTPIDLDASIFNTEIATQFVVDFFATEHSNDILNRLVKSSNITISTIEVFTASSDVVSTELQGYVYIPSNSSPSSKSKVLKALAGVSGTIICLAVVALIVSTFLRGHNGRRNDLLGINKRETRTITFPTTDASDMERVDQTYSDIENEIDDDHCNDDLVVTRNDKQPETGEITLKRGDPPIVSAESFTIDNDDDDEDETVITRNQVSPTTSQYNSPTSTNTSSNDSPVWSMFSGHSTEHTTSPYSTEDVLHKRYRWHESDADDDVDINQLLSLPEEPRSPGASSYDISKFGTVDESDSTGSSTSHDS